MSVTNGTASVTALQGGRVGPILLKELFASITASGNLTLTNQYRNVLKIDPGGAHRDVTLPAEEDGLVFFIINAADAAENLVVKDDAAATVVTINQNESAIVCCMGTTWYLLGVFSTAIS